MTILFVSLSWHPLLVTVWVSFLFLSLMACTQWPNSILLVWVVCHPSRTLPPKEPWQEPQNRYSPLPTTKPYLLTSDPWPHCAMYWLDTGWWGLGLARAFLPCMSKNLLAALSSSMVWRLACTSCSSFFDLLCELLFDFPLVLGADIYLLLGFILHSAHFLITLISYHITLSFLL